MALAAKEVVGAVVAPEVTETVSLESEGVAVGAVTQVPDQAPAPLDHPHRPRHGDL